MSEALLLSHDNLKEKHEQRAFIVSRILLVISLLNAALYAYIGYNGDYNLLNVLAGGLVFYAGLLFFVGHWVRSGRVYFGAQVMILGAVGIGLLAGLTIANLGIVIALAVVLVVMLLSSLMLPQSLILRMVGIGVGAGVAIIVVDEFAGYERVVVPTVEAIIPILAVLMIVVFTLYVLRNFREYSLRAKLIIATLVVAIGAIAAVTIMVSFTTRNALETQVGNNLNNLANAQGLAVGELFLRQIDTLEAVGLNRTILGAAQAKNGTYSEDATETQKTINSFEARWRRAESTDALVLSVLNNSSSRELLNFQKSFPAHKISLLTDQQGALIAATEQVDHYDFSDEVWWQEAYQDGFGAIYIGEPDYDSVLNEVVVEIAIPVRDETILGRVNTIGVLFTTISLQELAGLVVQGQFGETGTVDLYFADEAIRLDVADVDNFAVSSVNTKDTLSVKELLASDRGFSKDIYRDVLGLMSFSPVKTLANIPQVDNLGWNVVVFQSEDEALASVDQQLRLNLFMGIVIVVVAGVMATFVAQFLSRPIQQLTDTAVAVTGGDYTARATVTSGDEIGTLANAFNDMTEQLQHAIEGLETRVEERTRALAASTEVSRSLSTILDPNQLVKEVVEQIQAAFHYYHVQIYIFDNAKENLVLAGGTGDAGQVMLAREHTIPAGKGLVGQTAVMNAPLLIPDVSQSDEWLPSALLPDTRAEMVVPIASGNNVFGVLDVQHDVVGGLTNEDIDLLQAIANQVAVALQNARLYASTQEQAQQEAVVNAISQQIQQATTMEKVLQIAAQELGRSLDVERVTVQIHRDKTRNGQA